MSMLALTPRPSRRGGTDTRSSTCARALRRSAALAGLLVAVPLGAQTPHEGHHGMHAAGESDAPARRGAAAATAAHAQMDGPVHGGPHMRLTALRTPTREDSLRAAAIERALLPVLARYADVRAAERDGFEPFAPQLRQQHVYHFTSKRNALRAAVRFDPARPTSLLYTKDAEGRFVLAGAMYTAPARASDDRLDARVPLSLARWHQHVAICLPERGDEARWVETEDGRMRFGPAGTIATEQACDAAAGRWHDRLFGWMVHANLVQTPAGPRIAWSDVH